MDALYQLSYSPEWKDNSTASGHGDDKPAVSHPGAKDYLIGPDG
jgi:hypothetical protein